MHFARVTYYVPLFNLYNWIHSSISMSSKFYSVCGLEIVYKIRVA